MDCYFLVYNTYTVHWLYHLTLRYIMSLKHMLLSLSCHVSFILLILDFIVFSCQINAHVNGNLCFPTKFFCIACFQVVRLLSLWVALTVLMLTESVMFGFLEDAFLKDRPFVCSLRCFLPLWDNEKKRQRLWKLCSVLINVSKVRAEVRKCTSVNLLQSLQQIIKRSYWFLEDERHVPCISF